MGRVRLESDERGLTWEARALATWLERLRGLLGTTCAAGAVLLLRCSSIHTYGMGYAIDVAFVGERGEGLSSERGLGPGEGRSCAGAACVLERPERDDDWPEPGEHLWACSTSADGVRG